MSNYARCCASDGAFFFTLRLQDQASDLLVQQIDVLRDATRLCIKRWPFSIDAAVVLPNRLHMIWCLPDGDDDYLKRWRMIRSTFAKHVTRPDDVAPSQIKPGKKALWQRGFWTHAIRDQADFDLHRHLIASAQVTAGLVHRTSDGQFSPVHQRKVGHNPPYSEPLAGLHQSQFKQLL